MNALAAAVLAAGELICEFDDSYKKSLLAPIAGDAPKTEFIIVFDQIGPESAQAVHTGRAGRRSVQVQQGTEFVHFVERDGTSLRVTSVTECLASNGKTCTRFAARHAWHFETRARFNPDDWLRRQPAGTAATGVCEPWKAE